MDFWQEGPGWVVGWDDGRNPYCTLLGGDDWAFELDYEETLSLIGQLQRLEAQQQQSLGELMDAESLTLTAGCEQLEVELAGYPGQFSLQIRLLTARGAEGRWPAGPASLVQSALRQLTARLAVRGSAVDNERGRPKELEP